LWDVAGAKELATLEGHIGGVNAVAFSPDGLLLATAGEDETARFWDVAGREEIATLTGHGDWVNELAFAPDGKTLATASDDRTIKVWSVPPAEKPDRQRDPGKEVK